MAAPATGAPEGSPSGLDSPNLELLTAIIAETAACGAGARDSAGRPAGAGGLRTAWRCEQYKLLDQDGC